MIHVQNLVLKCFMNDHTVLITGCREWNSYGISFSLDIFEIDLRMYLREKVKT